MVKDKTVDNWELPCFGYTLKENSNEVDKIYCRVCRLFYGERKNLLKLQGRTKNQLNAFIEGTSIVKKCNALIHVSNGTAHDTAVLSLSDNPPEELGDLFTKKKQTTSSTTTLVNDSASSSSTQSTIRTMFRKLTTLNKQQLLKKFQLAHFIGTRALSHSMYEHFSQFEKEIHGVDLGGGYLTRSACTEIIHFLAKTEVKKNVTDPLNTSRRKYYSLLSDGSSNAKTMDEKELVLIKTCNEGRPTFNVLGLQVVEEGNHVGIANAIQGAVDKAGFNFSRRDKEVGLCTDGASVNVAAANTIKEDLDIADNYLHLLCPAHKVELAIKDAFEVIPFDEEAQKDLTDIYYFFKKANLKWRLFKRQAVFMEMEYSRYKRASGTRWVQHQVAATDSFLKNLPVLIAFFNQQIAAPHNDSMKKCVPRLQGLEEQIAKVDKIVYMAVKHDVLEIVMPLSKSLQDNDLLTPELISSVRKCMEALEKLNKLVDECGTSAFTQFENIFPVASRIISQLKEDDIVINDRALRSRPDVNTTHTSLHGFRLRGNMEVALERTKSRFDKILVALVDVVNRRFAEILENPIYKAMAVFLDTASYGSMGYSIIVDSMREIVLKFRHQLDANECDIDRLEDELRTLLMHVGEFLQKLTPINAWKVLFKKKNSLGITNVLHIAEICIVSPLGNAEVERLFSLLWRIFCKERCSLSNKVQEDLLRLRGSAVSKDVTDYADSMELFLSEYPDGNVRERSRRLSGHSYPKNRKSRCKKPRINVQSTINELVSSDSDESDDSDCSDDSASGRRINDINLDDISDDEWSSSSDEE